MIIDLKEKIKKLQCDYAEIHFEILKINKIVLSNDNIEVIHTGKTSSGNIRVLINNGWGFASFNGDNFEDFLQKAYQNAKLTSSYIKNKRKLINKYFPPIKDSKKTNYEIDPDKFDLSYKFELIKKYNNILKHPKISNTKGVYTDWNLEKYFINTEGSEIKQNKIFTGISFGAVAREGNNLQQAYQSIGQYGGLELVLNKEEEIEKVKKRALDLLNAEKIQGGKYNVILDPVLAGVFIHEAFGHLSEADFIAENERIKKIMKKGKRFGSEILNVVDDGSIENLAGYTPYDDEGVPGRKNIIIKNGILHGRLHSRETSCLMNEEPTGNARAINPYHQPIVRMTNTYIDNGDKSFEELLTLLNDGIYACDYLGGMTNLEMFTFSAGYAFKVEGGKIKELLRDVVLSGNVFTTLKNIQAIGNDLQFHGGLGGCGKNGQSGLPVSTGSPHILIKNVLVGGV